MQSFKIWPVLFAAILSWAGSAQADTTQWVTSISTATLIFCPVSAAPMATGSYYPVSATPFNPTNSVAVTWTAGTSLVARLNAGIVSECTVPAPWMSNVAMARTLNWGHSPSVDALAPITVRATAGALPVNGRIAAQLNVPAGAYSDTVTVTDCMPRAGSLWRRVVGTAGPIIRVDTVTGAGQVQLVPKLDD